MVFLRYRKYWRLTFIVISIFFLTRPLLRAEYSRYDQVIQVSLGGTTGANRYYDEMSSAGMDVGAAYRIYAFPNERFSVGAELSNTSFKDKPTADVDTRTDVALFSYGAFVRYDINPAADTIAYFSAGALALDYTKDLHTSVGTTNTNTTRGGYMFALGFDHPIDVDWRLGAEIRTIGDAFHFVQAVTGKLTLGYLWSVE